MSLIEHIDTSSPKIRSFGILFGCLTALIAAFNAYHAGTAWVWWGAASAMFFFCAFFGRPLLRPIYIGWMMFAFGLGWVNSRLLLGVFFYVILTPLGVLLRLAGKDLLDERIERDKKSYWIMRDPKTFDPRRCERMF